MKRISTIKRKTRETEIELTLDLDGSGVCEIDTPVGFFSHMLESFAVHGSMDLAVRACGDVELDPHHLVEDCGIVLGQAFCGALGDKRGIRRAGFFIYPMDEALAIAAVDFGGRSFLQFEAVFERQYCGSMDTGLFEDFFQAVAVNAAANLVVRVPHGRNDHHKAEAAFKALGRAVRMACEIDERNKAKIPSTKGVI